MTQDNGVLDVHGHRRFTGIEFAVVHAQPPSFFVIHKRERLSPDEGRNPSLVIIGNQLNLMTPELQCDQWSHISS